MRLDFLALLLQISFGARLSQFHAPGASYLEDLREEIPVAHPIKYQLRSIGSLSGYNVVYDKQQAGMSVAALNLHQIRVSHVDTPYSVVARRQRHIPDSETERNISVKRVDDLSVCRSSTRNCNQR